MHPAFSNASIISLSDKPVFPYLTCSAKLASNIWGVCGKYPIFFLKFNKSNFLILILFKNTSPLFAIFNLGINNFTSKCAEVGVDGLIIVDLQPEEDSELFIAAKEKNIDLIRLITPTTKKERLHNILQNASGFLYYVTITGITGQHSANINDLKESINFIKSSTNLPVVAGFGIKNRKDVENISIFSDGVVVGSSLVNIIKDNLQNKSLMLNEIDTFTKDLKKGIKAWIG